jgi:hypothetical protein
LYPKDLRRHKTTHTGSKHYKCPLCHKSFSRKDNLRRHVNNEHGASDVALPDGVPVVARSGSAGGDDSDTEVPPKRDGSDGVVKNGARGKEKVQSYIGMDNNRPQNTALASHHANPYQDATQGTGRIYEPSNRAQAPGASNLTTVNTQTDPRNNVLLVRPKPRPRAIPNANPTPPYHPPVRTGITLICPFRRMKPLVHYCYSHPATIKNLVHHMKTTHNTFFHTYCLQIFPSQAALTAHDKQRVCCRSCKKNCGTREIKATHVCKPSELTLDQMWHHLYMIACGDGVWHNPFHGEDYDGAEQEARLRYPPAMPSASGAGAPPGPAPAPPPAPSPASSTRRRPAPLQHRPMPESNGSMPPDDESSDDGGGSMRPAPRTSPGGSEVSRYAAAAAAEGKAHEYERSNQRTNGEGVYNAATYPEDDHSGDSNHSGDSDDSDDSDDIDESCDDDIEDYDDESVMSLPTSPAELKNCIRNLERALEVLRINNENVKLDRDKIMRERDSTRRDLAIKSHEYDRIKLDRYNIMADRDRLRKDLDRERTLSRQLTATGDERLLHISRLEMENRSLKATNGAAAAVAAAATSRAADRYGADDGGFLGDGDAATTRGAKRRRAQQPWRQQQQPQPPPTEATLEPPSLVAGSDTASSSARTRAPRGGVPPAPAPPLASLLPPPPPPGAGRKAASGPVMAAMEEGVQWGSSPDIWLNYPSPFDLDAGAGGVAYTYQGLQ